ncbi:unnamed protein product, partial [Scytosiphon promiscuus]
AGTTLLVHARVMLCGGSRRMWKMRVIRDEFDSREPLEADQDTESSQWPLTRKVSLQIKKKSEINPALRHAVIRCPHRLASPVFVVASVDSWSHYPEFSVSSFHMRWRNLYDHANR